MCAAETSCGMGELFLSACLVFLTGIRTFDDAEALATGRDAATIKKRRIASA
eukprot:m.707778 g.707778  ORF g.707778 m.707778 type:complete len:52 (+) comp22936_c1_seq3:2912-3067(+)